MFLERCTNAVATPFGVTGALIAPLHGKVKVPANYIHVTDKTSI